MKKTENMTEILTKPALAPENVDEMTPPMQRLWFSFTLTIVKGVHAVLSTQVSTAFSNPPQDGDINSSRGAKATVVGSWC